MIELAQHIEVLLLENDCVIVPGFGGFVTHYAPATYLKEENLFLPPMRSIGFNSQLRLNDGVLVQSYMSAYDTSFSDATRMVEKEVVVFIELLHKEGKADLENIGEMHYNIYGNYEFIPYDHRIVTPSFYGLDSFEMQKLSGLPQKEKVLIPVLEKENKNYEISINRTFLRNAVAMVAAIVLFFAFSTPVDNTYIQKNNYAQLLPCELFEQIEQQSVAVTPVLNKRNVTVTQNDPASPTKKVLANQKARPIAVKEIKVTKKKEAAFVSALSQPQSKNLYHIIVAGGISMKDAERLMNQLKAKGFYKATTLNDDGKIRVSIYSFNNRNEATKQLLELRKNEKFNSAWLLAK